MWGFATKPFANGERSMVKENERKTTWKWVRQFVCVKRLLALAFVGQETFLVVTIMIWATTLVYRNGRLPCSDI